jgi:hypothetical protein
MPTPRLARNSLETALHFSRPCAPLLLAEGFDFTGGLQQAVEDCCNSATYPTNMARCAPPNGRFCQTDLLLVYHFQIRMLQGDVNSALLGYQHRAVDNVANIGRTTKNHSDYF